MSDTCTTCGWTNTPDLPPRARRGLVTVHDEYDQLLGGPGTRCTWCVLPLLTDVEHGDIALTLTVVRTAVPVPA